MTLEILMTENTAKAPLLLFGQDEICYSGDLSMKKKKKRISRTGREIPRSQWTKFFNQFSQEHEGWLAGVEVTEKGRRTGVEARTLPLQGISVDLKEGANDTTSIMLDMKPTLHLTHLVPRTKHVLLNENQHELEVVAAGGEKTIVHFQSPW